MGIIIFRGRHLERRGRRGIISWERSYPPTTWSLWSSSWEQWFRKSSTATACWTFYFLDSITDARFVLVVKLMLSGMLIDHTCFTIAVPCPTIYYPIILFLA